jgi:hypothetical protein
MGAYLAKRKAQFRGGPTRRLGRNADRASRMTLATVPARFLPHLRENISESSGSSRPWRRPEFRRTITGTYGDVLVLVGKSYLSTCALKPVHKNVSLGFRGIGLAKYRPRIQWCGRPDSNRHGESPNGFSYHLRLSPPPTWRLWSGLSLHPSKSCRRCCPSSLYTFPFPGLARDCQ